MSGAASVEGGAGGGGSKLGWLIAATMRRFAPRSSRWQVSCYLRVPLVSPPIGPSSEDFAVFRPAWVGCKIAISG